MDPLSMFGLSATEAVDVIQPLIIFVFGMVVYAMFVFKFYKFVGRQDIFEKEGKYDRFKEGIKKTHSRAVVSILRFFQYILFYPVILFFWFIVFFVLLALLSEGNAMMIMLVAAAVVGAIRVTSYYKEDLSNDLAKLLPLALLGVFIVDMSFFNIERSFEVLRTSFDNPFLWKILVYYLFFIITLEFILRVAHFVYHTIVPVAEKS